MILRPCKRKTNLSVLLVLLFYGLYGNNSKVATKYINEFSPIAIAEMHRVGVPASIKLAQGLLESSWGKSSLATKANNHFGIKCGGSWEGKEIYRKDDDYNKSGKLMKSCFRAYDSASESYRAHSDFLLKKRYEDLFDLSTLDYKGWAEGLKAAGYASDPKYPQKLIFLIEKYELHDLDEEKNTLYMNEAIAKASDQNNQMPTVDVSQYESPRNRSRMTTTASNNNKRNKRHQDLDRKYKQRVSKNNSSRVLTKYHIVRTDESMSSIAKQYGIKLKKLYSYNRIPEGSQVISGEEIKLDGYIHWGRKPKYVKKEKFLNDSEEAQEELLFVDEYGSQ